MLFGCPVLMVVLIKKCHKKCQKKPPPHGNSVATSSRPDTTGRDQQGLAFPNSVYRDVDKEFTIKL